MKPHRSSFIKTTVALFFLSLFATGCAREQTPQAPPATSSAISPDAPPSRSGLLSHRAVVSPGLESPDEETVLVDLSEVGPQNPDGSINVLVEVPAGTIAKFELAKSQKVLALEYKTGQPRLVDFLPYPSNYGMVPKTLVPLETGGDGDPLDVVVLGPALARGQVVPARIIGALKMLDHGEVDDKLIAVSIVGYNPFSSLTRLQDLKERYPAALDILKLWFENYKGPGKVKTVGWSEAEEAEKVFERSVAAFDAKQK